MASRAADELVSVVIPTHNRRHRLEKAIESARQQTWRTIEIIVVDDASSDETARYLEALAKIDSRVRFVRNSIPRGGAGARNVGIELARGEYVAFLDDDDIWLPEKIATQVQMLCSSASASAVSCSFTVRYSSGRIATTQIFAPVDEQQILRVNHLGGASMCLARRNILLELGGFDAALRSCQDWDLWIRLNDRGAVLVCPEPLVCYVPHEDERITGNPRSTYAGRRWILFRYRSRMSPETRRHHLSELLYCRKVLLVQSVWQRLRGLFSIATSAGCGKALRFTLRMVRNGLGA